MFREFNEEVDSVEQRLARKNRMNPQYVSTTSNKYIYIYTVCMTSIMRRNPCPRRPPNQAGLCDLIRYRWKDKVGNPTDHAVWLVRIVLLLTSVPYVWTSCWCFGTSPTW
eukprot:jgi/Botrbrau1/17062/Bobra.0258s0005.1